MFDLINGIPLHPLVVHAIVVLLPLATLGTLAIAIRPVWRGQYGPLVVAAAFVATVLCPVATSSGEELEHRVGEPGQHAELGEQLIWFAIPLLVLSAALVWLDWKVFEPGQTSGNHGGAGLGLPLAQRIARSAGGDVRLVSPRNPTRFVVDLPRA